MKNVTTILLAILALMLGGYSNADELTDGARGLCTAIKTCALEAVADQSLSDELRQSMDAALEANCAEMSSRAQAVSTDHNIYQPAVECLRSMATLSCNLLHNMSEVKTPECAEYDQLLKAAGAETP